MLEATSRERFSMERNIILRKEQLPQHDIQRRVTVAELSNSSIPKVISLGSVCGRCFAEQQDSQPDIASAVLLLNLGSLVSGSDSKPVVFAYVR